MALHLSLSPKAFEALERLGRAHPGQDLHLAVVPECACGKMAFTWTWEPRADSPALALEVAGVRIVADPAQADQIDGADVDYEDALMTKRFVVHHPRVITECQGPRIGGD
ncbi:MAG: hypothetical protein K6U14_01235 [Firmicutes bacterium]|nr:hypothetical protein [Alicyclobacillaceae bacterium]MCL6496242.1 hypothetical protein [Bacillota bacterium]